MKRFAILFLFVFALSLSANPVELTNDNQTSEQKSQTIITEDKDSALQSENTSPTERVTNTWTGTISTNWGFYMNWSQNHTPVVSEDVFIPAGLPRYPVINSTYNAVCTSMTMQAGGSITVQGILDITNSFESYGSINVQGTMNVGAILNTSGNVNISGILTMGSYLDDFGSITLSSETAELQVGGNAYFRSGSSLVIIDDMLSDPEISIMGSLYFYAGSNVNTTHGIIKLLGGTQFIVTYAPVAFKTLNVYSSNCVFATGSSGNLTLHGSLNVLSSAHFTCEANVTTTIKGTVYVVSTADLWFPSGNTVLSGTTNTGVTLSSGSYFKSLDISKSAGQTVTLNSHLRLNSNLYINSGSLDASMWDIYIAGNWTNYVGESGFYGGAHVYFNGSADQYINTPESFVILDLSKSISTGILYIPEGVTVASSVYRWHSGTLTVQGGFSTNSLPANTVEGDIIISGTVDYYLDSSNYILLTGSVIINGGTFNIYGGWDYAYFTNTLYFAMGSGILDIKDASLIINENADVALYGGTIRTTGDLQIMNNAFDASGGAFEIYGNDNSSDIYVAPGAQIHDLIISKGTMYSVSVSSALVMTGYLRVASTGCLYLDLNEFTVYGSVQVYGSLYILENAVLFLGSGGSLTVYSGGNLYISGNQANNTFITCVGYSGTYSFLVQSGGTIGAQYTVFEFMDANGISIQNGATVNPAASFNNCVFRNGALAGRLLTIDNNQDLNIFGAVFPNNPTGCSYNVSKVSDRGSVNFYTYSGTFSGATFEQDPFNRINWNTAIPPVEDLSLTYDSSQHLLYLSWTYPIPGAMFNLYYSDTPNGPFNVLANISQTHSYLAPSTAMFFKITAVLP